MQEHQTDIKNITLFISDNTLPITANWLDSNSWTKQTKNNDASGRGSVYFIESEFGQFVIRKYLRGGLIRKLTESKFLFTGVKQSRPYKELTLLEYMQEKKLPAPRPVAGICHKQGIHYEASIMTHLIPEAMELFHLMQPSRFECNDWPKVNWQAIGSIISRFHDAGIDHTDLNCHNIMLDKNNKIWLIDFDKCSKRTPNKSWQKNNLARLQRSLEKESQRHDEFQYNDMDWQRLLEGYHA